jgi:hypothetical protein
MSQGLWAAKPDRDGGAGPGRSIDGRRPAGAGPVFRDKISLGGDEGRPGPRMSHFVVVRCVKDGRTY